LDRAEVSASRAASIAEQRRDSTRRAAAFRLMARIARTYDRRSPHGVTLLERALTLCQLGEDAQLRVEILSDLGDAYRDGGERARARESWRRALEIARIAGYTTLITEVQVRLRSPTPGRGHGAQEATAS
jgi:hypothetical protein